eukprot:1182550-Prorocentrum_minimum.AAC.6
MCAPLQVCGGGKGEGTGRCRPPKLDDALPREDLCVGHGPARGPARLQHPALRGRRCRRAWPGAANLRELLCELLSQLVVNFVKL